MNILSLSTLSTLGLFNLAPSLTPTVTPAVAPAYAKTFVADAGMPSISPSTNPLGQNLIPAIIGKDSNSALNPFIQPTDKALSGGGRDQSQQFFDLLIGNVYGPGVVIGRLGVDVMIGGPSVDVMIGGPEHFNPNNRDKAFGLAGDDVFLWSPGDGSDRFDGGTGLDTLVFGLMGEKDANGKIVFKVTNDQKAGNVFLDPQNFGLPKMDVTNSPGFCKIIDRSSSANAWSELQKIDSTHLAQFIIRNVDREFRAGRQKTDNGLRVTLSLKDVEFLVCASQAGGQIQAYDLRQSPPKLVPLSYVPWAVRLIVK